MKSSSSFQISDDNVFEQITDNNFYWLSGSCYFLVVSNDNVLNIAIDNAFEFRSWNFTIENATEI